MECKWHGRDTSSIIRTRVILFPIIVVEHSCNITSWIYNISVTLKIFNIFMVQLFMLYSSMLARSLFRKKNHNWKDDGEIGYCWRSLGN